MPPLINPQACTIIHVIESCHCRLYVVRCICPAIYGLPICGASALHLFLLPPTHLRSICPASVSPPAYPSTEHLPCVCFSSRLPIYGASALHLFLLPPSPPPLCLTPDSCTVTQYPMLSALSSSTSTPVFHVTPRVVSTLVVIPTDVVCSVL